MPAASFNSASAAAAAVIVNTMLAHNSPVSAKAESGLLINNGVDITPSRERTVHKAPNGVEAVALLTNPIVTLSFDAKVMLEFHATDAPMSFRHPGTAIPLATVQNYFDKVYCGVTPDENSWWEMMEPSLNVPPGDLISQRFSLRLWNPDHLAAGTYTYFGNAA